MEAPYEIWLRLAQRFRRRRFFKMVDGRTDNRRRQTDDGACLYYKLTNEPKGSGELKMFPIWLMLNFLFCFVLFITVKTDSKLTLHQMGTFFIIIQLTVTGALHF